MTILSFHDVARTFADGTRALDRVSFKVQEGELVAVVGPSGCGKSTLLRLAAHLDVPSSGKVTSTARAEIAFVFQDPTLLPWRSVRANVELLGELRGKSRRERARDAQEVLALVGLEGFEGHLPRALSGGMQTRTSLARALTLRPRLFLLDEPFAAVDELTRERLNEQVLSIFAERRVAAVLVTHSVAEAVFMASRVLVMSPRPGRIMRDIAVSFPYPRETALRFTPRFADVAATVSRAVRGEAA